MTNFLFLDKRVQKTKTTLYEAFFSLLEQKPYKDIKVTDIIAQAQCSRATFYTHYKQKDDLLEDVIQFLFKELTKAYRSTYIEKISINVQSFTNEPLNLLNHFIQFGRYYQLLLGNHIQIDFRDKITNHFIELYLADFEIKPMQYNEKINEDFLKRYSGYGLAGLIIDWVKDDFPIEPQKLSEEIVNTFKHSLGIIHVKKR